MTNQLIPLEPPFTREIEEVLASYPKQNDYLLSLFRTFANGLRFLKKGVPNLLDKDSPLDLRTREIVILRTTANRNCEYEWGVHVSIFANAAHLTDDQVNATRLNNLNCWSAEENHLIAAVDQLCKSSALETETLAQFQSAWSCDQQLEIMAIVGTYSTISYVANVAQLPLETFSARFPKALND